jgi:hypothetical protein
LAGDNLLLRHFGLYEKVVMMCVVTSITVAMVMLLRYFGLIEQYLWLRMFSTLDFPVTLDGQFALLHISVMVFVLQKKEIDNSSPGLIAELLTL